MKTILIAIATFGMIAGHALETRAASLNTHPTGPGLSCGKPNNVTARSNPLTCTNHYEISGYCTQGREGPGGNPYTQIEAGRAVYTVTSDWNGYKQEFTQHFSLSGGYYKDSDKNKGTVVSHCSDDPMLNKVTCKTDPIEWTVWGKSTYHDPGLRGIFPLTDIGMSSAALRKKLLANSTGPQIKNPKLYQKFKSHNVLVFFKAALPCGMSSSAKYAVLMIQREKDVPTKAKGWVNVTWVNAPSRKVRITNNGGFVKLPDLPSGTWRVRAQVTSPFKGIAGNWQQFTILGPTGVSIARHGAGLVSGKVKSKHFAGQQFGQQSNQKNSQNTKIRFGAKVTHSTAPKAKLPAVQQHAMTHNNIRFGSKLNNKLALKQPAPVMHTLSTHAPANTHPKRYARVATPKARIQARVAPQLKLLQKQETTAGACRNLGGFITIRQTLYNAGGPLAADQAQLFVQERGGAHIQSRHVSVPAMAHGAKVVLTLTAGTQARYRAQVPGMHRLPVTLTLHGKTTTSPLTLRLAKGLCQVAQPRTRVSPQMHVKPGVHRLTLPAR